MTEQQLPDGMSMIEFLDALHSYKEMFVEKATTTNENNREIPILRFRMTHALKPEMKEKTHSTLPPSWQMRNDILEKSSNRDIKYGSCINSAQEQRDILIRNYIYQIKEYIEKSREARRIKVEFRPVDVDLIPVVVKTFVLKDYKCIIENVHNIVISW